MLNLLILFLVVLVIILGKDAFTKSKYEAIETYFVNNYYSTEHLENAIRSELQEKVDEKESSLEFIEANFDNYVINLIIDDINRYESDKIAHYNRYLRKEDAEEILEELTAYESVIVDTEEGICYIKIPDFRDKKTYSELKEYKDIFGEHRKYIVDLRNNMGGSTRELVRVLSLFYPKGSTVYTEIRDCEIKKIKTSDEPIIDFDKLIFLCNEQTASASEVLMYNLKSDFPDKVEFVGSKTKGKNFSYSYREFPDGELFMFVSGQMGNSQGVTFEGDGINPDYLAEGEKALEKAKQLLNQP